MSVLCQNFTRRYSINDPEFQTLMSNNKEFISLITTVGVTEFVPLLKYFIYKKYTRTLHLHKVFRTFIERKMQEHLDSYDPNIMRDFADALIAAKLEAEQEQRDSAQHLNQTNLALTLLNLLVHDNFRFHS